MTSCFQHENITSLKKENRSKCLSFALFNFNNACAVFLLECSVLSKIKKTYFPLSMLFPLTLLVGYSKNILLPRAIKYKT